MKTKDKKNPHVGSSLEDLLQEDGTYEEVTARAKARALDINAADRITAEEFDRLVDEGKEDVIQYFDLENPRRGISGEGKQG
jgi:hypothetical protein